MYNINSRKMGIWLELIICENENWVLILLMPNWSHNFSCSLSSSQNADKVTFFFLSQSKCLIGVTQPTAKQLRLRGIRWEYSLPLNRSWITWKKWILVLSQLWWYQVPTTILAYLWLHLLSEKVISLHLQKVTSTFYIIKLSSLIGKLNMWLESAACSQQNTFIPLEPVSFLKDPLLTLQGTCFSMWKIQKQKQPELNSNSTLPWIVFVRKWFAILANVVNRKGGGTHFG